MNGKIDLRIVKTYGKLKDALSDMMMEKTFDDITVFDLCERAEVRRATFYKHFKDKYDFLKSITSGIINDMASSLVSSDCTLLSPVDYFTRFVDQVIVYFDNRPHILSNLLNSNAFPILFDIITGCTHSELVNNLYDAKKIGVHLTTDITFTADFINGGIANILLAWFKNPIVSRDILLSRINELLAKIFA